MPAATDHSAKADLLARRARLLEACPPELGNVMLTCTGSEANDLTVRVARSVTLGKPMGDGHPIAAMIAWPALLEEFGLRSRYFNTFGGNAARVGSHLLDGLGALKERYFDIIGDVRGVGLYAMVEMVADPAARTASRPPSSTACGARASSSGSAAIGLRASRSARPCPSRRKTGRMSWNGWSAFCGLCPPARPPR